MASVFLTLAQAVIERPASLPATSFPILHTVLAGLIVDVATIRDEKRKQSASVYVRKERAGWTVVGVDREGADRWEVQ